MTRETVWCETPARRATSKMLAPARARVSATFVARARGTRRDAQPARGASRRSRRRTRTVSTIRPSCRTATRSPTRSTSSSSAEMNTTDRPFSASSPTRFWISTFAPTSMPRVGSSRTSTRGESASRRASSTFCWLPPDSVPAGRSRSGGRMSSASTQLAASSRCRAGRIRRRIPRSACSASVMFSWTLSSADDALGCAGSPRSRRRRARSPCAGSPRFSSRCSDADDSRRRACRRRSARAPARSAPSRAGPRRPAPRPRRCRRRRRRCREPTVMPARAEERGPVDPRRAAAAGRWPGSWPTLRPSIFCTRSIAQQLARSGTRRRACRRAGR